ncbi:MAG TPA: hypothetical protein VK154_00965 [Chitinophagales bacterium]|nr:hypothetical protein [Chitinophagales bacterium]
MRKSAFIFLSVFCVLCLVSACKYSDKYQQVNAKNKFTLSVPPWMSEEKGLKTGADFEYANRFRNFYAIGEAIPKADLKRTPGQVMNDNLNVLRKSMTKPQVTDSTEVNAGNIKGIRVELYGKMTGEDVYFSEVLFEGADNIYHLSIWTRSGNRKLHFKGDIDKIIASFREI